jgi:hypothetical protein
MPRGALPNQIAGMPAVDLGGKRAIAISGAAHRMSVVLDEGTVESWGNGGYGRLGYGNSDYIGDASGELAAMPNVDVGSTGPAIDVAKYRCERCQLFSDQRINCFGAGWCWLTLRSKSARSAATG